MENIVTFTFNNAKPNHLYMGTIFLLGGYDLEMLTIKDILVSNNCRYADRHLHWHEAGLSEYQDVISDFTERYPDGVIYGIELENDIPSLPKGYKPVDHHNESADRPSALEQILDILSVPMDRHYQLVALNDRSYIPGMRSAGATDEEVSGIRAADRKAQGVTDNDEELAEKAISDSLERYGDLIVVKALSSKFSPICDRLFPYTALLIYNAEEFVYYGKSARQISGMLENDGTRMNFYSGGGADGYFGAKRSVFTSDEINEYVTRIKKLYV